MPIAKDSKTAPPHTSHQRPPHHSHSPVSAEKTPEFEDPSEHSSHNTPGKPKYIGNYEIIKTIGEGSFAKVKLGIHRLTGQKVSFTLTMHKAQSSFNLYNRLPLKSLTRPRSLMSTRPRISIGRRISCAQLTIQTLSSSLR
jgi:hypothetical protein